MLQFMKNAIGRCFGLGTCPNCNDSWWRNDFESLVIEGPFGLMVCTKCMSTPDKLNEEVIRQSLSKDGHWSNGALDEIVNAIKRHKAK